MWHASSQSVWTAYQKDHEAPPQIIDQHMKLECRDELSCGCARAAVPHELSADSA